MQLKIMLLFNLSENGNFTIKNFKFLYKNNKNGYLKLGNILIQWGFVSVPTNQYTLIYPVAYKELPSIVTSNWSLNGIVTHTGRSQSQCLFSSNTGSMGFDWMTVGVV